MNDKTKGLIEKIRALMQRTTENGCTEAEAMTAARLAKKLMDNVGLTADEILAGQTKASADHWKREEAEHPVSFCAKAVGRFSGTRIYSNTYRETVHQRDLFGDGTSHTETYKHLRIVGLQHEIEIASYMLDICYNAMQASAAKALLEENEERARGKEPLLAGKERLAWVYDYQRGMAVRMAMNLEDMAVERDGPAAQLTGGGNALVVVRDNLIAQWFADNGIKLKQQRGSAVRHRSGFEAGKTAGGRVGFHSGVGSGQRTVHQIGGR